MISLRALLIALALGGCAARYGDAMSVSELESRHIALNSGVVKVHGWLLPCGGRSCLMVGSPEHADWLDAMAASQVNESAKIPPEPRDRASVSFAASPQFDRQVAGLRDSIAEVVVEARVTDRCWTEIDEKTGNIVFCVDRADQLEPIRLVRVIQLEPALIGLDH